MGIVSFVYAWVMDREGTYRSITSGEAEACEALTGAGGVFADVSS